MEQCHHFRTLSKSITDLGKNLVVSLLWRAAMYTLCYRSILIREHRQNPEEGSKEVRDVEAGKL